MIGFARSHGVYVLGFFILGNMRGTIRKVAKLCSSLVAVEVKIASAIEPANLLKEWHVRCSIAFIEKEKRDYRGRYERWFK